MIAADLLKLLEAKHSDDVFVPECKDGPTHGGGHSRLDAWAMARSWARPYVYGYEIKVSRSDFLKDDKWPAYLPMCNLLYFVCPTGLIQPDELPAEVGLLWASKTGTKLYTKKKAAHRDVQIPENVWRYILMCRARITREHSSQGMREFWADWLRGKRIDRDFGYGVSSTLAKRIREEVLAARAENARLQGLIERYEEIRKFLESIGVDPSNGYGLSTFSVERRLKEARDVLPKGLVRDLQAVAEAAARAKDGLEKLSGGER